VVSVQVITRRTTTWGDAGEIGGKVTASGALARTEKK
jgi:hypothetical protein